MSILIRGLEMPACCDECSALDDYRDLPLCTITMEQEGHMFDATSSRMKNCPIIEIPEAVKPTVTCRATYTMWYCGCCGKRVALASKECKNCGTRIDWEHYIPRSKSEAEHD